MGATHIRQAGASQRDLPRILSKEDQARAFRRARRHTLFVKALKLLLPAASLTIVALYFVPDGKIVIPLESPVTIESLDLSGGGLKMMNPRYTGSNEKLGRYRIEAEYALQQIDAVHRLQMHNITAEIVHPDNKTTKMTASKGTYDTKAEQMQLEGVIEITSDRGMSARLSSANVDVKQQMIATDQPVMMMMNDNRIDAANMNLSTKEKRVSFNGGVKVRVRQPAKTDLPNADSKEPVDIEADRLDVFDAKKEAVFNGNVKAHQGAYQIVASELRVGYAGSLGGDLEKSEGNSLRTIEAVDKVVISLPDAQRVTSERAHFDLAGKLINISGGVLIAQNGNEIRGDRLAVDLNRKRARFDPAADGDGRDKRKRISCTLLPAKLEKSDKPKPTEPRARTADAAAGATGGIGGPGFTMQSSDQPVHIEADLLEVMDDRKFALFSGNVVAWQDKFEMISKELKINYVGGVTPQPRNGEAGAIKSIEATGRVAIATPDNQRATSDTAHIDAVTRIVTIGGNVVLSQGGNVMRGDKLVIDLNTGRSRFDATATAEGEKKGKRPRVSGVFLPGKLKEGLADPALQGQPKQGAAQPAAKQAAPKQQEQPPLPWQKGAPAAGN